MIGRRLAIAAGLLVLGAACSKATPPDEATLRAEDKLVLEGIIASDVRASQAMREADTATGKGNPDAAADAVSARARPAIEEALRAAESATLKTDWGRSKRDELASILRDRKAAMPTYEEAVMGGDPEKMLAAIEAQAAIERRALATVAAVKTGR
ncbi:hypothetical protein BH11MYX4_BH11MYX4_65590 [soil metagenome]